jgi:hypothetical protein
MGSVRKLTAVLSALVLLPLAGIVRAPVAGASAIVGPVGRADAGLDISATWNFFAFDSTSVRLGVGQDTGRDVFSYDRRTRTTELMSIADDGSDPAAASWGPTISDDGRYVAFVSNSTELVAGDDDDNAPDVYVRDRVAGTTELVSTEIPSPAEGPDFLGGHVADISGDGRTVVFVANRPFEGTDCAVFVRDLVAGATSGGESCFSEYTAHVSISDDGRFFTVSSEFGGMLVDRASDRRRRLPAPPGWTEGRSAVVAGDGGRVVFGVSQPGGRAVRTMLWDVARASARQVGGGDPVAMSDNGRFVGLPRTTILDTRDGTRHRLPHGCSSLPTLRALSDSGRWAAYIAQGSSEEFRAEVVERPPVSYRMAAADGGVFTFGEAQFRGSMGGTQLVSPIVDMGLSHIEIGPSGRREGYWLAAADGGVFAFGTARFRGSMGGRPLRSPIVAMATTLDGYWLVAADGGVFAFGNARFYGSMGGRRLNSPIVGIAPNWDEGGYWLVAADGGVFAFGSARFRGSTGGIRLASPIVAMAPAGWTPSTPLAQREGYILAARDGGVFTFGRARFKGSAANASLTAPIVSVQAAPETCGYRLAGRDGAQYPFSASSAGSLVGRRLSAPIVAVR